MGTKQSSESSNLESRSLSIKAGWHSEFKLSPGAARIEYVRNPPLDPHNTWPPGLRHIQPLIGVGKKFRQAFQPLLTCCLTR
jgi:hypothetical protein